MFRLHFYKKIRSSKYRLNHGKAEADIFATGLEFLLRQVKLKNTG